MPTAAVGNHRVSTSGLPIRLKVYDLTESRKFAVEESTSTLKLSSKDFAETGFVAYFDYYLEDNGGITTGFLQVHPFYKNKRILTNIMIFFENRIPETASLDIHHIASPFVLSQVEKTERRNNLKINYSKALFSTHT